MAVFTVFTLVAVVSYLFTWKTDQSLLSDPQMMDASVKVSNAAGKIGYQWSHLLVARWFGLGAFALVLVLAILSMRMLLGTRPFSVIKAVLLSLTAAFLSSFILAYVSILTGAETLFGGGLGGDCGSYMIKWSQNLVGTILTFFVLAVFVALWFLVASRRFSEWFIGLGGEKADAPAPESVPAEEEKPKRGFTFVEKLVDEVHAIADEEPVSIPEPEPEVAPEPAPQPASPAPVAKAEVHADDGLEVVAGDELSTDTGP